VHHPHYLHVTHPNHASDASLVHSVMPLGHLANTMALPYVYAPHEHPPFPHAHQFLHPLGMDLHVHGGVGVIHPFSNVNPFHPFGHSLNMQAAAARHFYPASRPGNYSLSTQRSPCHANQLHPVQFNRWLYMLTVYRGVSAVPVLPGQAVFPRAGDRLYTAAGECVNCLHVNSHPMIPRPAADAVGLHPHIKVVAGSNPDSAPPDPAAAAQTNVNGEGGSP